METKQLNTLAFNYILNAIDSEGYEVTTNTDQEKIQFVLTTFISEQSYNIDYYGNIQTAFTNWLMGLPSCVNIDFENYQIIELAKNWGSIPQNATEAQEDKIINNWFNFITNKFFQLAKKNKVTFDECAAMAELQKMLR